MADHESTPDVDRIIASGFQTPADSLYAFAAALEAGVATLDEDADVECPGCGEPVPRPPIPPDTVMAFRRAVRALREATERMAEERGP